MTAYLKNLEQSSIYGFIWFSISFVILFCLICCLVSSVGATVFIRRRKKLKDSKKKKPPKGSNYVTLQIDVTENEF